MPLSERTIAEIREGARRTGDAAADIEQTIARLERSSTLNALLNTGKVKADIPANWRPLVGPASCYVGNQKVKDPDPKNFPSEQFIASLIILIGAIG